MPGRAGSVFGPSKLLLEGGVKEKFQVLAYLRWKGLTKILSSFDFYYPVFLAKISNIH
jgi:hypothetical protein